MNNKHTKFNDMKPLEEFSTELLEDVMKGTSVSNIMAQIDEYIKPLRHYADTTSGLWATDRPDLINDPKKVLFRIKSPITNKT